MKTNDTVFSLASVLDEALSPLDSLTGLLAAGGHTEVADVSASLLRDAHARLQSVARCLEAGCGRQVVLRDLGGVLCPVACVRVKKKDCRASGMADSPD